VFIPKLLEEEPKMVFNFEVIGARLAAWIPIGREKKRSTAKIFVIA